MHARDVQLTQCRTGWWHRSGPGLHAVPCCCKGKWKYTRGNILDHHLSVLYVPLSSGQPRSTLGYLMLSPSPPGTNRLMINGTPHIPFSVLGECACSWMPWELGLQAETYRAARLHPCTLHSSARDLGDQTSSRQDTYSDG